jgi:hypothetical protein
MPSNPWLDKLCVGLKLQELFVLTLQESTGHYGNEPEQQHRPSLRQNTSGRYVWEAPDGGWSFWFV